mmetsp:Transcript_5934/g.15730  ORF Transcript_5934/g.15730 Transcript_5934/m.15730 type:complete len:275 (-) Transcript_5934:365-1189(-)
MGRAPHNPGLSTNTCCFHLFAIRQALVPQRIELVDADNMGWQSIQICIDRQPWPCEWIIRMIELWVVHAREKRQAVRVEQVVVALLQRSVRLRPPNRRPSNEGTQCEHTVKLSSAPLSLGTESRGDAQVASPGLARQNELRYTELVTPGTQPRQSAHAVVQPSRERMGPQLARGIAKLNAGNHKATEGQMNPPCADICVASGEHAHSSPMHMQDARNRLGHLRLCHEQGDSVTVGSRNYLRELVDGGCVRHCNCGQGRRQSFHEFVPHVLQEAS